MSARPAGHPQLKAELSEAIAALIADEGARGVSAMVGRNKGVAGDRGGDVDAWPISELRMLADHSREIDIALRAYVCGEQTSKSKGEAVAAVGDLLRHVSARGTFIAHATTALADGRVTVTEASELLSLIYKCREEEDAALIPSLTACIREG